MDEMDQQKDGREEKREEERSVLRRQGVRQAARVYLKRGWGVVELRPRDKAPARHGWQEMRIEERAIDTTFLPGSNIGLLTGKASGGLVDVDCDTLEAQIAATTLLPMTPMMHGREHGEFTHYWYQIEGSLPKTEKFAWREELREEEPQKRAGGNAPETLHTTPQTTMLIELRANGCQTMVPPSLHPDGGCLRWAGGMSEPLFPTRVSATELRRAVAKTAAAALLARYWPAPGGRDEAALSLAGWLVKSGWTDDDAEEFILAVARAAQDEEWKRRAGKTARSREAVASGGPVMSVNALAARLRGGSAYGAMVVAMVAQWLGMPRPYGSKEPPVFTVVNQNHEHGEHGLDQLDQEAVGTLLSEVTVAPVRWLWPGRIPLGKQTILDGDPGLGKSLITLDLIARVTTARGMPDEPGSLQRAIPGEAHGAVLLSAEDGLGDTIAPRLQAGGADLSLTLALQTVREADLLMGTTYERGFLLTRDLETLARAIERMRAWLVVIDPLMAFLDPSVNSFRDQDARLTLSPLSHLAEETGAAVLILRHLNKSAGGNALYRGGGSIGFIGAVRSGLVAAKDPDDPEHRRVLASSKSNLGPPLPSLRYRLVVDEGQAQPRVEWLGTCDYTADALLAASVEPAGAVEEAIAWLEEQLAAGPRRGSDVKQLAAQAGISAETLRRARERRCVAEKRPPFTWMLRGESDHADQEG